MINPIVPNHPECRRWLLGITGPTENKFRVIITKEYDGCWVYRYKRPRENNFVQLARVESIQPDTLFQRIHTDTLISELI